MHFNVCYSCKRREDEHCPCVLTFHMFDGSLSLLLVIVTHNICDPPQDVVQQSGDDTVTHATTRHARSVTKDNGICTY